MCLQEASCLILWCPFSLFHGPYAGVCLAHHVFSHYSWFTVFCPFSTVQQSNLVALSLSLTHTHIHTYIYVYSLGFSFDLEFTPLDLMAKFSFLLGALLSVNLNWQLIPFGHLCTDLLISRIPCWYWLQGKTQVRFVTVSLGKGTCARS